MRASVTTGTGLGTSVGCAGAGPSRSHTDGSLRIFLIGSEPAKEQLMGFSEDVGGNIVANDILPSSEVNRGNLVSDGVLSSSVDTQAQSSVPSPISELAGGHMVKPDRSSWPLGMVFVADFPGLGNLSSVGSELAFEDQPVEKVSSNSIWKLRFWVIKSLVLWLHLLDVV